MYDFTEIQEFLIFILHGIIYCLFFEFFASIRKNFKSNIIITNIEDLSLVLIISVIFILSFIYVCQGIMRGYIVIGLLFGVIIYLLTIRKMCAIIFYRIIRKFKSFFTFLLKFVKKLSEAL